MVASRTIFKEILVVEGRLLRRTFFLEVANRVFFCFEVGFCPVNRGNRAGSSRNESDYSRGGAQITLPLLDCRSCENSD